MENLTQTNVRFCAYVRQLLRGYTTIRAIEHELLRGIKIRGSCIDLASGKPLSSEYDYLDFVGGKQIDFCDLLPRAENVLKVNLEEPLPFGDLSYDNVFLFHALQYIYDYKALVKEMHRVTRNMIIIIVPYSLQYAPDPVIDYFRFNADGLSRVVSDAGFGNCEIISIKKGPFLLAFSNLEFLVRNGCARAILACVPWLMDCIVTSIPRYRRYIEKRSNIGFICLAWK